MLADVGVFSRLAGLVASSDTLASAVSIEGAAFFVELLVFE